MAVIVEVVVGRWRRLWRRRRVEVAIDATITMVVLVVVEGVNGGSDNENGGNDGGDDRETVKIRAQHNSFHCKIRCFFYKKKLFGLFSFLKCSLFYKEFFINCVWPSFSF